MSELECALVAIRASSSRVSRRSKLAAEGVEVAVAIELQVFDKREAPSVSPASAIAGEVQLDDL